MRTTLSWTLAAWICIVPAAAAQKTKPKPPTVAQLKAEIQQLTEERDELSQKLSGLDDLQQELATCRQGRDLARQDADSLRKELGGIKASLNENQSGADAILKDLQQTKSDFAACSAERENLKKELDAANVRLKTRDEAMADNGLPNLMPARPLNLNRVTPKVKNVSRGVVVINVLISENGEVLDTRLIQGLPGTDVYVQKANENCLEAAKRVVFDPARSADGKAKLRVWQAVGFLVD